MKLASLVPPAFRRQVPLVEYLAARFTYHSYDDWRAIAEDGRITCNGIAAGPDRSVSAGDTVSYDAGEFEEPAADLSYRICWEDGWLLGVSKPGNLLVHRAGKSFRNNLIYQLRHVHVPPYPDAHAVHRLDRKTSGVVCVAKDARVLPALSRAFAGGRVEKTYAAVVRGVPRAGTIDLPIGKPAEAAAPCAHGVAAGGKAARTEIVDSRPLGRDHAFLTVRPLTGRTHQIRVHLAASGTPVVGDWLYGTERDMFPRNALHCASLSFVHPVTGKTCRMETPLPADMRGLIERLSGR